MTKEAALCLLFCPALLTGTVLWSVVLSIYELGKSRTRVRKEKRQIPFLGRLLLIGYARRCEYHALAARRLCYLSWVYMLAILAGTALWLCGLEHALYLCAALKACILDIPINVYGFVMTKHGKSGGVVWKWEK